MTHILHQDLEHATCLKCHFSAQILCSLRHIFGQSKTAPNRSSPTHRQTKRPVVQVITQRLGLAVIGVVQVITSCFHMGVEPKIGGNPPNHPFVHWGFHYFHHPVWVVFLIFFWQHPNIGYYIGVSW